MIPLSALLLSQLGIVEFGPVVEVVEIDGVARSFRIVLEIRGAEDRPAGFVVVIVTTDGCIELFNRSLVDLGARLLADPLFELTVCWALLGDVGHERIAIEIETIDDHLIETFAHGRVTGCEFAAGIKRDFEPKSRKVQNTQWSCDAGT